MSKRDDERRQFGACLGRRQRQVRLAGHALQRRAQVDATVVPAHARSLSWRRRHTGSRRQASARRASLRSSNSTRGHGLEVGLRQALAVGEVERRIEASSSFAVSLAGFGGVAGRSAASASATVRAAARPSRRPVILGRTGTSAAREAGSRQKASDAASKITCCSWRSIITADSAACTSRVGRHRFASSAVGRETRSGPMLSPAVRNAREVDEVLAGHATAPALPRRVARSARARVIVRGAWRSPPCMRAMSSWYFSSTPRVSFTVSPGRGGRR